MPWKFHFAQKKRRIPVSIAVCRALPFVKCRLLLSFVCILPTSFLAEFCTAKCVCATCQWLHYNKIPQKNGGYSLVSPFVGHCRLLSVAFCFHSFVFYRRRFLPSFAPQSVFVPLANSYTTIKYPQKNGGYPLVSPFVLHCFMCSNYFVLSCLFFSILSFCPLVSFISAFMSFHNSLATNV